MNESFIKLYRDFSYNSYALSTAKDWRKELLTDLDIAYRNAIVRFNAPQSDIDSCTRKFHFDALLKVLQMKEQELILELFSSEVDIHSWFNLFSANPILQENIYQLHQLVMEIESRTLNFKTKDIIKHYGIKKIIEGLLWMDFHTVVDEIISVYNKNIVRIILQEFAKYNSPVYETVNRYFYIFNNYLKKRPLSVIEKKNHLTNEPRSIYLEHIFGLFSMKLNIEDPLFEGRISKLGFMFYKSDSFVYERLIRRFKLIKEQNIELTSDLIFDCINKGTFPFSYRIQELGGLLDKDI